ncbi:CWC16 protein [Bombardia bombarda]|uniref:Splicing factor YJU2 n=1 Tax=Bombardia bombarda TaxID=252184 RepID=A0AA39WB84_9PEZI|nr:CWC16 protein [Bombardia bombarda]
MSERKVLNQYYPPDFDPALLGRSRGPKQVGPKVQTVRLMAPFSMRCTACGEYMYRGRKFNARKETPKRSAISASNYTASTSGARDALLRLIIFRTDPKNQNYIMEKGAKRNTEPWRRGMGEELDESDDARLDRIERDMADADGLEERNAMAELEAKTADAKREMAVADALDEIRSRNARLERAQRGGVEIDVVAKVLPGDEERRRQEEEDAEAARRAFAFARGQSALEEVMEEEEGRGMWLADVKPAAAPAPSTDMPPPSFKRVVKKKKDHAALLGIKKKQPLV